MKRTPRTSQVRKGGLPPLSCRKLIMRFVRIFAVKALSYGVFALPVLVAALTGCSTNHAQPLSKRAQPSLPNVGITEPPPATRDQSLANREPLNLPLLKPRLEVWKGQRKLLLFSDEHILFARTTLDSV